jgi:hypothetical protein
VALGTDKKGRSVGGAVSPALKAGEVYVLFLIETKKKKITIRSAQRDG